MYDSTGPALTVAVDCHPSLVLIDVTGDLDIDGAPALCAAIEDGRRPLGPDHVIVDLSDVRFCDSTGLRALIEAAREVTVAGGQLIVIVPEDGPVRRLIALTGAQEFLGVTADREQVLDRLRRVRGRVASASVG
jgi:anti-sigma B factor antagonist